MPFSDQLLSALGAWQAGWREEKALREQISVDLHKAIEAAKPLPEEAFNIPGTCYRKRFLVPNNPQNGGDFWPFFWDGEIQEGAASWSTDYEFCKTIFKKDPRPGTIVCIFRRVPTQSEVILNIAELWTNSDFKEAIQSYADRREPNFEALQHFRDVQSEVILDAPLTMDDVVAFCGQVPSLEQLCNAAQIEQPEDEDELWRRLVQKNLLPTLPYWLEGQASQRAIDNAIKVIEERFRIWLKPK